MSQALAAEMRRLARRSSCRCSASAIFAAAIFRHSADVCMTPVMADAAGTRLFKTEQLRPNLCSAFAAAAVAAAGVAK
jgi:hypothetical protein